MGRKKIDINVEELVKLKEQGMSDKAIADYLKGQGIEISYRTVNYKLTEYYKSKGEEKPKGKRKQKEIDIKELIELKEQGMSDRAISDCLKEKGIRISHSTVNNRLTEYYNSQGKEKPPKIDMNIEEIVKLKEQGMSNKAIVEYLKEKGIEISCTVVNNRLTEFYKSKGMVKPKANKKKIEKVRQYDNETKEILMQGMSIEEFISEYDQEENEEIIRKNLKKLRVVAEYSEKENSEFKVDISFIEVIDILENIEENTNKYGKLIGRYISNGMCEKGKIDLIRDKIFAGNTDLMTYMLKRLKVNLYKGYDVRVFDKYKKQYEEKIDTYLGRIEIVDNNRKQKKKSKNNNAERGFDE